MPRPAPARAASFCWIRGTSCIAFAATPRNTHGSQIARRQSGYKITVRRNCDIRRAVRQKIVM